VNGCVVIGNDDCFSFETIAAVMVLFTVLTLRSLVASLVAGDVTLSDKRLAEAPVVVDVVVQHVVETPGE